MLEKEEEIKVLAEGDKYLTNSARRKTQKDLKKAKQNIVKELKDVGLFLRKKSL